MKGEVIFDFIANSCEEDKESLREAVSRAINKANIDTSIKRKIDHIIAQLQETLEDKSNKRLRQIIQNIRGLLSEKVARGSWSSRILECTTQQDFNNLFASLNLKNEQWKSTGWLGKNAYSGLVDAITKRFESWRQFLLFMGEKLHESWPERVAACKTKQDFRKLFENENLKIEQWIKSSWLSANGYQYLYRAIRDRFDGNWESFIKFMGEQKQETWAERVAKCKTPESFLKFFSDLNLTPEQWKNSWSMRNKGYAGLQKALIDRFGSWQSFHTFMGLGMKAHEKVKLCRSCEDFLNLFASLNLKTEQWKNSGQLQIYGHSGIYKAIRRRFGDWKSFLQFMRDELKVAGHEVKVTWAERLAECKTREDFLSFFAKEKLKPEQWKNSYLMRTRKYGGLVTAIFSRFGSWKFFLQFMCDEVNVTWAERLAECKTREDFLSFFAKEKLKPEQWKNSSWLTKNGYPGLRKALTELFGTWESFVQFMGEEEIRKKWFRKVQACKTREDLLRLFEDEGLLHDQWINSRWLNDNGYSRLYGVLFERFDKDWKAFLQFMETSDHSIDEEFDKFCHLRLEDAIALLQHDPLKLKLYLLLNHKELTEKEVDRLVKTSFRGLISEANESKENEYLEYSARLPELQLRKIPATTKKDSIVLTGKAVGADAVYMAGCWNRRIKVEADGSFIMNVPLKIGEPNEIRIIGINRDQKTRTRQHLSIVQQEGEPDDIKALISLLSQMGTDAIAEIQNNPGKRSFLIECAEQILIKKFSRSFEAGEKYVAYLMGNSTPVIEGILRKVLANFRSIQKRKYPNVRGENPLYFFQKYSEAAIQRAIEAGESGIILASEPGLGKTPTAWVAINGYKALIVAPNSVVSPWGEAANKFLKNSDILMLQNMQYREREEKLRTSKAKHVVTNIEFVRDIENDERFKLLSDDETIIVHDEAHSRTNLTTRQTKGMRKLKGKFTLLITATPAKDSKTFRRMMHTLEPDNPAYASDAAFEKAFPSSDPQALRTLSLLKRKRTIRFRKQDVLEEVDPKLPLAQQHDRLPHKEYIDPSEAGEFEMSEAQAYALYEMFLNWQKWTKKYNHYLPKDHVARLDNLRVGDSFSKKHALRQTVNNPAYIGAEGERDRKAEELERIVEQCLEEGRPVVIFCAYNAQTEKYARMFAKHNPAIYTGITSEKGVKRDAKKKPIRYRKNVNGGWEFDERGLPIEDPNGEQMLALDYERLTFQKTKDRKVLIATYSAGAIGTTFTKGKAVIKDDLPDDCIQEIQMEDRTHRIDHDHQTHYDVKYFTMKSTYPEKFLKHMKRRWVEKMPDGTYREELNAELAKSKGLLTAYDMFFAQKTYDEVKMKNLRIQRQMFHLVNDGIADDSVLKEGQIQFKPFTVDEEGAA